MINEAAQVSGMVASRPVRKSVTKGEGIYRQLKRRILEGALQPGQLISANRLSKDMGVARSVVCESLARLKAEGLVRGEGAYARTYVEQRDLPAVVEHYEVRESIEGTAARLAAQNMNAWQVAELRRIADQMLEASRDSNADIFLGLNLAFHHYLVANCGNELLSRIYETHHLAPVSVRSAELTEVSQADGAFYHRLCDAIEARDGDEAERFLREDLRAITSVLRSAAQSRQTDPANEIGNELRNVSEKSNGE